LYTLYRRFRPATTVNENIKSSHYASLSLQAMCGPNYSCPYPRSGFPTSPTIMIARMATPGWRSMIQKTSHGDMAIRVHLLLFHHVEPRIRLKTPPPMWNLRLTNSSLNMFFPSLRFWRFQRRARHSSHLFKSRRITHTHTQDVDQTSTPLHNHERAALDAAHVRTIKRQDPGNGRPTGAIASLC